VKELLSLFEDRGRAISFVKHRRFDIDAFFVETSLNMSDFASLSDHFYEKKLAILLQSAQGIKFILN
jgi:hypothetical protein